MPLPKDLIHVVSTTTGTGDMTVSAVVRNFSDSDAFGTGTTTDVFDYFGWNDDVPGEWERGTGHMSATNTLVRDTIKASSNGGAAVNWSAGTKHFANDVPATKQVTTDGAQTLTNKTLDNASNSIMGLSSQPQGRLTLTSGVAVTTSDVAGATTIYYTPTVGTGVPLYDGTATKMADIGGELSLALDATSSDTGYHQSGKNFDLFVFDDAGTMRLGTGPAWSSDTSRGTGAGATELELKNGFWTNKQSITARFGSSSGDTVSLSANLGLYVGSFRTVADGQVSDTASLRLLCNAYNQAQRVIFVADSVNSFTYSTAAWQQYNNNTANQIAVLDGLGNLIVSAKAAALFHSASTALDICYVGIGIDTSTVSSAQLANQGLSNSSTNSNGCPMAFFDGGVNLGYHTVRWLQYGGGADTQTWFGTASGVRLFKSGLSGCIWA